MGESTDEMLKAVAAANELVRREVTQALAAVVLADGARRSRRKP
jgi:hypothetical protein